MALDPGLEAYLRDLEAFRLRLEERLIHLPETSSFLARYEGRGPISARSLLHAIPVALSLWHSLVYSPRTNEELSRRYQRCGCSCPFDPPKVGYQLTIWSIAFIYREVAKRTGEPQLAKELATIMVLTSYGYGDLERVDWAVTALEKSKGGGPAWLAPAMLLTISLNGLESEQAARAVAGFLEQYRAYTLQTWEAALENKLLLEVPW